MIDETLKECIRHCWDARHATQECFIHHCLPIGGPHMEEEHVKLMLDCIQICQTAADFMTRNSAHYAVICAACAEICDACAKSCERIGDDAMNACAEACRACAQSCRRMSKMTSKAA